MRYSSARNSIFSKTATVVDHQTYPGDQFVLRLQEAEIATHCLAGHFVHLRCDDSLPMRRPMSIMRASAEQGWIDILYKVHGYGTQLLSRRRPGDLIEVLGPIGFPFKQGSYREKPLLIGGGIGVPPMIYLAEHLKNHSEKTQPLVMIGSENPFPFSLAPSKIMIPGIPEGVIASMPLMEDWNIPCRLSSRRDYPGCFKGLVTDLARVWLEGHGSYLDKIEIFACGPTPMLQAVAYLAQEHSLPCQVSLEAYMACAVGGCAGCVVKVETGQGIMMKRVCVDGPVFESETIFPLPK